MLTDYESIIIAEGEAAEKIVSGEVKTEIVQLSSAEGYTENSFERNVGMIQGISTVVNEDEVRVKFSVLCRQDTALKSDRTEVKFSSPVNADFLIKTKSDVKRIENSIVSGLRIEPSPVKGKLELTFITDEDDDIVSAAPEPENADDSTEIIKENNELEEQLGEASEKNAQLSEKISILNSENEKLSEEINSINALKQKNEVLKKNLEEEFPDDKVIENLKNQLGCYSEILEYYRTESGYITVNEKLNCIVSDIQTLENSIAELVKLRQEENK